MGWSEDQFWYSTPTYFYHARRAWVAETERIQINQLAQTRLICWYALHGAPEKMPHLTDIIQLPGDDKPKMDWVKIDPAVLANFQKNIEADIKKEQERWQQ